MRPWAIALYFTLFGLAAVITLATLNPQLRLVDVEAVLPGFYTHVSNLVISCALILVYGIVRLIYGAKIGEIAIFTLVVVAANYGYEGLLTLYNTKDLVDAHYGLASSVVTFALFAAIKAYGLKPVTPPRDRSVLQLGSQAG